MRHIGSEMMIDLLAHRAWYDLHSTAHAHGLPFHTRQPKAQVRQRLYQQLIQDGYLRRRYKRLSPREKHALMTLKMAGGMLPWPRVRRIYGPLRIARPWRPHIPAHPWKQPQSVTERLWHLGFIEIIKGRPDQVALPREVMALLPSVPSPAPVGQENVVFHAPTALCVDLAALLGTLLTQPVLLQHGRWLPLSALRRINAQLNEPVDLSSIRSERQSGQLHFLHYLAEVAGLIVAPGRRALPAIDAWRWFDLDPHQRWQTLIDAVTADLRGRHRLWDHYRLPLISPTLWQDLVTTLTRLPAGIYDGAVLSRCLRLVAPEASVLRCARFQKRSGHLSPRPSKSSYRSVCYRRGLRRIHDIITPLLRGPLAWLGLMRKKGSTVLIPEKRFSAAQFACLTRQLDHLHLALPAVPPLRAYVSACAWATLERRGLRIDAVAVRRAVEQGLDAATVVQTLIELMGGSVSSDVITQIQEWVRDASAVMLRAVTLLTVRDSQTMSALSTDWRLKPLLGQSLSPHHRAVSALHVPKLRQMLARRGHPAIQISPCPLDETVLPSMAAYAWLAMRLYQRLEALVNQAIPIPAAIRDCFTFGLTPGHINSLDQESQRLFEALCQQLRGKTTSAPFVQQDQPDIIRAAIQAAYEQRRAVCIAYLSPSRDAPTERMIEPHVLSTRGGVTYIEAWCRLDDDTRTFRMDRILRILDESPSG